MAKVRSKVNALAPLLGEWQSDRDKTLQYWAFPRSATARAKKFFRSKDFFGHLRFRISPKRFTATYEGKSYSQPYRVLFHGAHRVLIVFGSGRTKDFRDLHFDGSDSFYMLAGKANCEFFRRLKANSALKGRRAKSARP